MTRELRSRRRSRASVATLCIALAACGATPPPAVDASQPPWLLRRTFPGWDGKPVEVLGAPGPRAVAAFLTLAMRRHGVSRPEDLGEALRQVPTFYRFHRTPAVVAPLAAVARWEIRSDLSFTWKGTDAELFQPGGHVHAAPWRHPEEVLEQLSLADLALAISDVVWKWPRLPGSRMLLRPPKSAEWVGDVSARMLRDKLDRGVPLERAWQELAFEWYDDVYVLTLLPGGLLRVEWHPEMDESDFPPPPPWEGKY